MVSKLRRVSLGLESVFHHPFRKRSYAVYVACAAHAAFRASPKSIPNGSTAGVNGQSEDYWEAGVRGLARWLTCSEPDIVNARVMDPSFSTAVPATRPDNEDRALRKVKDIRRDAFRYRSQEEKHLPQVSNTALQPRRDEFSTHQLSL